ncbi:MAG: elongation factor Ts [Bacteroidia bacterium]|nr:elongation factor Ts [Bacteroidia bacterium]
MAQITTADITKLRQLTGAGMMDCKNALTESEGDVNIAIEIIRKKGQAVSMKRADRQTTQGLVVAEISPNGKDAAIIALSCETDFVAKTDGFIELSKIIAQKALEAKPANIDELKQINVNNLTIQDMIMDKVAAIGERIDVTYYEHISAEHVFSYIHQGSKIGTLVGFNKMVSNQQIGKDVAMQIAAMSPIAIDKDDISKEMVEKEIEIGKEQARAEGKPEAMLEKIAMGKLNKFYNESTLLNQEFVKDNKMTVRQYIQNGDKDLSITVFKRCSITL